MTTGKNRIKKSCTLGLSLLATVNAFSNQVGLKAKSVHQNDLVGLMNPQTIIAPPPSIVASVGDEDTNSILDPLSSNPLIFRSKKPLLDSNQCEVLKQWVRMTLQQYNQSELSMEMIKSGLQRNEEGAFILSSLQRNLWYMLHGDANIMREEDHVVPRYLQYVETQSPLQSQYYYGSKEEMFNSVIQTYADILPDGLHVDTNNSKHFRHWTVLLYLNDCDLLGATTFPLATPLNNNVEIHDNEARKMAEQLIIEDMHHTKMADATERQLSMGKVIDEAALTLVKSNDVNMGLRVLPKVGNICLFSNLKSDGYPNHLSFHGSEAMLPGESKDVLTFFFEVPPTFSSRVEFGQRVQEREELFCQIHGFSGLR